MALLIPSQPIPKPPPPGIGQAFDWLLVPTMGHLLAKTLHKKNYTLVLFETQACFIKHQKYKPYIKNIYVNSFS